MKQTITLLLLLLSIQLLAQQIKPNPSLPKLPTTHVLAVDCNMDSILQFRYTSPTDSVISQKTIYNYYSENSYSSRTIKPINNGTDFKVIQIDSFVLDAQGRTLDYFQLGLEQMKILSRVTYYPHGNTSNYDSIISYQSPGQTNMLEPIARFDYFYDAEDKNVEFITYFWQNGSWLNAQKITNSFDNLGNVVASTVNNWNGTEWVPYSEINSTTSSNITETTQIEIATGLPLGRELVTTVPSGDTLTISIQGWDTIAMAWQPGGALTTIYYDDLERITQYFTTLTLPGFTNGNRVAYRYLGETECYTVTEQFNYAAGTGNFVLDTRDFYFYPNASNTQQLPSNTAQLAISPNPHNGWVQVTSTPNQPVEMYDLQGRLLRRFVSQGTDLVPVSGETIIVRQGRAVRVLLGE